MTSFRPAYLSPPLPSLVYTVFSFVLLALFNVPVNAAQTFVNDRTGKEAARYDALLKQQHRLGSDNVSKLLRTGDALTKARQSRRAVNAYGAAYVASENANDNRSVRALLRLSSALLASPTKKYSERYTFPERAGSSAYLAYGKAQSEVSRAHALSLLAKAYQRRSMWRDSLKAYRFSLAHKERETVRTAYNLLYKKRGFRMVDYKIDSDSINPRLCLNFSEKLKSGEDYAKYIAVQGQQQPALSATNRQICIEGMRHGERYKVNLRAGLPAQIDDRLQKSSTLSVYVKDRSPSVRLSANKYVLPSTGQSGIPVTSVNTDKAHIEIYRVNDRSLGTAVQGDFLKQLAGYNIDKLKQSLGQKIWRGILDIKPDLNKDVVTAFPVTKAIPNILPGVYILVADANNKPRDSWKQKATQWFIVSDLGLSGLSAQDGIHAFVRSLKTAETMGDVTVRLIAKNNEILGSQTTDGGGFVSFSKGLANGEGGMSPALLVAQTKQGDYAFLNLTSPAFDLSDRGVAGRAPSGPVDVHLFTERGVYKPGERVHVTGLARDNNAKALSGLPLTFKFTRPDGLEHKRPLVKDEGLGGHTFSLSLPLSAKTGTWRVAAYTDVKKAAVGEASFLVEDFVPERMDLTLKSPSKSLSAATPAVIELNGQYLYGAPARDLAVEGEMIVSATRRLAAGFKGYRFGLAGEKVKTIRHNFTNLPRTNETGKAHMQAQLPPLAATTKPLEAKLTLRLRDPSGRAIERKLTLPVAPQTPLIGIKPLFEELDENTMAEFNIAVMGVDGKQREFKNLTWELVELHTRYQWYRSDGRWNYEKIVSEERLDKGRIDAKADQPARLAAKTKWGRYRLDVRSEATGRPAASYIFQAGWYASALSDTPDMLDVALDKKDYNVGDTAQLRIVSRMAGKALITVLNGGIRAMKTVNVPKGESTTDLLVDESWGAGAYVAVNLYRPMEIENKRMPGRAIGLSWLNAGHSKRLLGVELQTPDKIRPDGSLDVPVTLTGLAPGEEAYIVASAVDVGVLNLTGYKPPAPEKHFLAQHKLGAEFRDLYGRLIDGMHGVRGSIRSGGDGAGRGANGMSMNGNPPDQKPLALYSGIVRVGDDGKAVLHFDIPAFNGTVKVMAAAWSANRMGHAAKNVVVRDRVIVSGTTPRFLKKGDRSQLHLVLHNVEGPSGEYELSLKSSLENLTIPQTLAVKLGPDQRQTFKVPLEPKTIGEATITAHLTGPEGINISRNYVIPVKPAYPTVTRQSVSQISSGTRLSLTSDIFTGFVPGTEKATLSVGPSSLPDIPGLLASLDRYPYGCSEQITSRALPLLYLSSVASQAGLSDHKEKDVKQRLQKAIDTLVSRQGHNGSFGLWSSGSGSPWLTAYVTEFLTRAREQGFDVPQRPLTAALDKLSNTLSYTPDFTYGGEAVAYSLYVLARNKRARLSELRYYADEKLKNFATPLAKAQLATALALYGDKQRAQTAYNAAISDLDRSAKTRKRNYHMSDYGSPLRDGAATLALVSETGLRASLLPAISSTLERQRDDTLANSTNTQEKAWLLLAANALFEEAKAYKLDLNGTAHSGLLTRNMSFATLGNPLNVTNKGDAQARAIITVSGSPEIPEPPRSNGFTITREVFTLAGEKADLSNVPQNTRLVVVIQVHEGKPLGGQMMISDPLPAGFEIDNPRLVSSANLSSLSWLAKSNKPKHTEFRDDRFLAAFDLKSGKARSFSTAYIVRAVAPGRYVHGPASVEDMYRVERVASTASGFVEVTNGR